MGDKNWENAAAGLVSNVYYWDTMAALQAPMKNEAHVSAKQPQARWLNGYQVVIGEVNHAHGDAGIDHPLANLAQRSNGKHKHEVPDERYRL